MKSFLHKRRWITARLNEFFVVIVCNFEWRSSRRKLSGVVHVLITVFIDEEISVRRKFSALVKSKRHLDRCVLDIELFMSFVFLISCLVD